MRVFSLLLFKCKTKQMIPEFPADDAKTVLVVVVLIAAKTVHTVR